MGELQYAPPLFSCSKLTQCLVYGNKLTAIVAAVCLFHPLTEQNRFGAHPSTVPASAVEGGERPQCDLRTGRVDLQQRKMYRWYSSRTAPKHIDSSERILPTDILHWSGWVNGKNRFFFQSHGKHNWDPLFSTLRLIRISFFDNEIIYMYLISLFFLRGAFCSILRNVWCSTNNGSRTGWGRLFPLGMWNKYFKVIYWNPFYCRLCVLVHSVRGDARNIAMLILDSWM